MNPVSRASPENRTTQVQSSSAGHIAVPMASIVSSGSKEDELHVSWSPTDRDKVNFITDENYSAGSGAGPGTTEIEELVSGHPTESSNPINLGGRKRAVRQWKKQNKMLKRQKSWYGKARRANAQQNAMNTASLVAVLIATVTFSAAISPPGGVHQDGQLIGTAVAGSEPLFKVFLVFDYIALFASLSVVSILSCLFPNRDKGLRALHCFSGCVTALALVSLIVSCLAATLLVLPRDSESRRLTKALIGIAIAWTAIIALYFAYRACLCLKRKNKNV